MDRDELLEMIMEDAKEKLRDYIQEYWYDTYTPKDYDRTYDLLNSVDAKIEGNEVVLYFDDYQISSNRTGGWGQHIGFEGEPFEIEFIEMGLGGSGSLRNPRRHDSGMRSLRRLRGWLSYYVNRAVKQAFGVNVRVISRSGGGN